MRRLFYLVTLLIALAALAPEMSAQNDYTSTANLGLKLPNYGSTNWAKYYNNDLTLIDQTIGFFHGGFYTVPFTNPLHLNLANGNTQFLTLSSNVTSSTLQQFGVTSGQIFYLLICQNATGGFGFTYPPTFQTSPAVSTTPLACTASAWIWVASLNQWVNVAGGSSGGGGGSGTVTSVALTLPSWLSVVGSPILTAGTLAISPTPAQTSHQVIGTCGSLTAFVPCNLALTDLPGGIGLTANPLSQFAATTSLQLAGVITNETGTGSLVFGTSPTLTTPTVSSATLTGASTVVPSGATITVQSGGALICASGSTCPAGLTNPMTTLGDSLTGGASGAPARLAGPTTPNGVPQFWTSTPSSSTATPQAWALSGLVSRQVTGTTAIDAITSTDCTNGVVYVGSVAVATSLPTPTSLGLLQCVFRVGNFTTGAAKLVTVTPTTLTADIPSCIGNSSCVNIWKVKQNQWCTFTVDGTNWDANCTDASVSYLTNFPVPSSPGHLSMQNCILAAVAAQGICDTQGFVGTVNTPTELEIGDQSGAGGFFKLRLRPGITVSSGSTTGGTSCMFKHWNGAVIEGDGMYNGIIFQPTNSSTNANYTWCTDGGTGYYQVSGISIQNKVAMNLSGYDVHLTGMLDGSYFDRNQLDTYENQAILFEHNCCAFSFSNNVINGNFTGLGGLDFEYASGVSNHGGTLSNNSIDHFALGTNHILVHDTASPAHTTLIFTGTTYLEANTGSTTVPCIEINGAAMVMFGFVEGCSTTSGKPALQIENVGNPLVTWTGFSNGVASYTAVNDLVTGGLGTVTTDALGHVGPLTTGSMTAQNVTAAGLMSIGSAPPACTPGTAFFICGNEGTTFANVAGAGGLYWDATAHEMLEKTNGASGAGMVLRAHPGSIHTTGLTGAVTTATLCAASAGACNVAGQYHIHLNLINTGTACSAIGSGTVAPSITWTDTNGTAHTAVPLPMITNVSATALATSFIPTVSVLTAWASGDINISTNGTVIQYATAYTGCGTGTLTYQIDASVTRMQ